MKKAIIFIFIVSIILVFPGCSNAEETPRGCTHVWKNATCLTPKTCTNCGITEGTIAGHNYVELKCTVCGDIDPIAKEIAAALEKCKRHIGYLDLNAQLLKSSCQLYRINGKTSTLIEVQNVVTEIVEDISKVYEYCKNYKELENLYYGCIEDIPMITTHSIASFESYAYKIGGIKGLYDKLCAQYNY